MTFREFLRQGNFKAVPKHEHTTDEGWFDMEEFTAEGNYFLLKRGRTWGSRKRSLPPLVR